MPCSSQIISEMLPEIHTTKKCYFLKPIIHSQMIYFSVGSGMAHCNSKFLTVNGYALQFSFLHPCQWKNILFTLKNYKKRIADHYLTSSLVILNS